MVYFPPQPTTIAFTQRSIPNREQQQDLIQHYKHIGSQLADRIIPQMDDVTEKLFELEEKLIPIDPKTHLQRIDWYGEVKALPYLTASISHAQDQLKLGLTTQFEKDLKTTFEQAKTCFEDKLNQHQFKLGANQDSHREALEKTHHDESKKGLESLKETLFEACRLDPFRSRQEHLELVQLKHKEINGEFFPPHTQMETHFKVQLPPFLCPSSVVNLKE